MKKLGHNIKQMFLHQILKEHIEKSKKHLEPCGDCIYDGIDKGYEQATKEIIKMIEEEIKIHDKKYASGRVRRVLNSIITKINGNTKSS